MHSKSGVGFAARYAALPAKIFAACSAGANRTNVWRTEHEAPGHLRLGLAVRHRQHALQPGHLPHQPGHLLLQLHRTPLHLPQSVLHHPRSLQLPQPVGQVEEAHPHERPHKEEAEHKAQGQQDHAVIAQTLHGGLPDLLSSSENPAKSPPETAVGVWEVGPGGLMSQDM